MKSFILLLVLLLLNLVYVRRMLSFFSAKVMYSMEFFLKATKTKRNPVLLTPQHLHPVLFVRQIHMHLEPCSNPIWINLDRAIKYIPRNSRFAISSLVPRLDAVNLWDPLSFCTCLPESTSVALLFPSTSFPVLR